MYSSDHERVTRALAARCGFPTDHLDEYAEAVRATDTARDARGRKVFDNARYHTKVCLFRDPRRATAQRHLAEAVALWNQGRRQDAVRSLGAGTHALQDLLAHGGMARSVLLHRKRGAWAWVARAQRALGLRDIDDWDTTPGAIQRRIESETRAYINRFLSGTQEGAGPGGHES